MKKSPNNDVATQLHDFLFKIMHKLRVYIIFVHRKLSHAVLFSLVFSIFFFIFNNHGNREAGRGEMVGAVGSKADTSPPAMCCEMLKLSQVPYIRDHAQLLSKSNTSFRFKRNNQLHPSLRMILSCSNMKELLLFLRQTSNEQGGFHRCALCISSLPSLTFDS